MLLKTVLSQHRVRTVLRFSGFTHCVKKFEAGFRRHSRLNKTEESKKITFRDDFVEFEDLALKLSSLYRKIGQ